MTRALIGGLVLWAAAFSATPVRAGNGVSRGGGGAWVCFANQADYESVIAKGAPGRSDTRFGSHDNNGQRSIPHEFLDRITLVQMMDIKVDVPTWMPKYHGVLAALDSPAVGATVLEAEYENAIGRIRESMPRVYEALKIAATALPYSQAEPTSEPIIPVADEYYGLGQPCRFAVKTSIIEQTGVGPNARLRIDQALFNHPKHELRSRVAGLIHERAYWISRQAVAKDGLLDYAANPVLFVRQLLAADTTFGLLLEHYDAVIGGNYGIHHSVWRSVAPAISISAFYDQLAALPLEVARAQYAQSIRARILALPGMLESDLRKVDRAFTRWLKRGELPLDELFNGTWPIDVRAARIPLESPSAKPRGSE